jgi:hypothetical protein
MGGLVGFGKGREGRCGAFGEGAKIFKKFWGAKGRRWWKLLADLLSRRPILQRVPNIVLLISHCWHSVRIWSKEPFTVEMNHVSRIFGNPHFGLPSNLRNECLHRLSRFERRDKHKSCVATGE